ncbi:universal stress protein [Halorussus ruber]|uniref:universal stress protein n=1 Tax=Halorussus ruber TaxID=1126238 RepID=UPI001092719C|nr:universal stress protein [Halorussus ruber]
MYEQLLFPTDGSDGASLALDHVLDIATSHDATVHVLNVADTTQDSLTQIQGEIIDVLEQEGEEIVQDAATRVQDRGVDVVTEVLQGEPYRTILNYADSHDIDLVVMPTHGRRGLERFLLGSTTERVVRRAETPVLTIRPDDETRITYPYRNVLVGTDGSDCADQALDVGVDVANADEAALHLLSVIALPSLGADVRLDLQMEALEEGAHTLLDDAAEVAADAGVEEVSTAVEHGPSIHQVILSYIEEHDIDIVVVGTQGRTGFDRYVLGSVSEYLVRTSPIPVLTVRASEQEV